LAKEKCSQEILRNQDFINKSFEYNYLKPWLGDGLITSNGAVWKTKRKLLSPSFHSKILEDYISVINEETKIFNQILSTHSDKECFDIRPLITNLTLDIISGK
ncbi:cytochrome P450 4c3-like protein, partial [Dinothrombium tinctorium]